MTSGCVLQSGDYVCNDGTVAPTPDACPNLNAVNTAPDVNVLLAKCDKFSDPEDRGSCYTITAIDTKDLSICDRLSDKIWKVVCYRKLNMSHLLPVETTTTLLTTTSTVVTTTTTTTTIKCGNGVIDSGEECDIGELCLGDDGVCGIIKGPQPMAVCLIGGKCDWNLQSPAREKHDMGQCNGCFGPTNESMCLCLKTPSYGQNASNNGGAIIGTADDNLEHHLECNQGRCARVDGEGTDSCTSDDGCRHYECQVWNGNNVCGIVRTPGASTCTKDVDCGGGSTPTTATTATTGTTLPTQTHTECQNAACVTVSGAGFNQCSSSIDCKGKKGG
jgi:hypothetical protein